MASARNWRPLAQIEGPFVARLEEIPALNVVFRIASSRSFSSRTSSRCGKASTA